ncbi:MAG: hypothetical protein KC620_12505, partial [Myxococcales bacterium]|nr:hypothetical protein [Myxococcales bacterium]
MLPLVLILPPLLGVVVRKRLGDVGAMGLALLPGIFATVWSQIDTAPAVDAIEALLLLSLGLGVALGGARGCTLGFQAAASGAVLAPCPFGASLGALALLVIGLAG